MNNPEFPRPLARRVLDTFTAPRRLAAGLGPSAPWFDVLALSTGAAVIAAATLPEEFFLERVENPVDRLGRPVEVSSSPAEVVRWGRYLQMFSALVQHPVVVLMAAALLTLIFTVIGRGEVGVRRHLSLAAHAFLIFALGTLVTVALQLASGDPTVYPSLAYLAGSAADARESTLAVLLDSVNPFTVWMLLVMAVGVSEMDGRISFPRAGTVLVGLYLGAALALAALA